MLGTGTSTKGAKDEKESYLAKTENSCESALCIFNRCSITLISAIMKIIAL